MEREQFRIAKMLHDGPCQTFTSARFLAEILLRDAQSRALDDGELHQKLAVALTAGVKELHEILLTLEKGES